MLSWYIISVHPADRPRRMSAPFNIGRRYFDTWITQHNYLAVVPGNEVVDDTIKVLRGTDNTDILGPYKPLNETTNGARVFERLSDAGLRIWYSDNGNYAHPDQIGQWYVGPKDLPLCEPPALSAAGTSGSPAQPLPHCLDAIVIDRPAWPILPRWRQPSWPPIATSDAAPPIT